MGAITPLHLILVLVVAVLVLGPGKLPETGKALGDAIRSFRHAVDAKDDPASGAEPAADESGEDKPA